MAERKTYAGSEGYIDIEGKKVVCFSKWEFTATRNIEKKPCLGSTFTQKQPGLIDWSGSIDGYTDFGTESGQKELWDAFALTKIDGPVNVIFGLDKETFFEGKAFISDYNVTDEAENGSECSISFEGDGELALKVAPLPPIKKEVIK